MPTPYAGKPAEMLACRARYTLNDSFSPSCPTIQPQRRKSRDTSSTIRANPLANSCKQHLGVLLVRLV
jgi:hypothetical protein